MNELLVFSLLLVPTQACIDKARAKAGKTDALGLKQTAILPKVEQLLTVELPKKADGCNKIYILDVARVQEYEPGMVKPAAWVLTSLKASGLPTAVEAPTTSTEPAKSK